MGEMNFDSLYEEIRRVIPDEETYRSVVDVIEAERQESVRRRKEKQADGIARAREANVSFGRPRKVRPKNYDRVMNLYRQKTISITQAARLLDVSRSVCYSWICEDRREAAEADTEEKENAESR